MISVERLECLLHEKHWSKRELERKAGIGTGNVSKWTHGGETTSENLKKVADVLGVSTAYLIGESDFRTEHDALIQKWVSEQSIGLADEVRRIEAGIRIPVLEEVPCGILIEEIEMIDADEWEEISENLARSGKFFGLKAKGSSMLPRIQEGDVLIVRQQSDADTGDIVVAQVNDGFECKSCCKKLIKTENAIILQSFNHAYEPLVFIGERIASVTIIGKVVENRQKF